MTIPFFLTRQTANLMEDFARELGSDGALFLLYGEDGVGKTRLLQELCHSRFGERRIHWLDLGSGDSADGTRLDYSHGIEDLFTKAEPGDLIIADHFEEALKKTRHQLFLSWSVEGVDKRLDMIIVSSNDGFNELRQLSQQYQVRIQSFQLMPFSGDEVEAFICFCLFPDNPTGKPKIPGPVRRQLAATQGNVGKLLEVIERDGKLVKAPAAVESESIRQGSRIIAAVLVMFVIAVGIGWYFFKGEEGSFTETVAVRDDPISAVEAAQSEATPSPVAAPANTAPAASRSDDDAPAARATAAAGGDAAAPGETGETFEAAPRPVDSAAESGAAADDAVSGAESTAASAPTAPEAADSATGLARATDADTGAPGAASGGAGFAAASGETPAPGAGEGGAATAARTAADAAAEQQIAAAGSGEVDPGPGARAAAIAVSEAPGEEPGAESQAGQLASVEPAMPQPQSSWERFARDLKASMQWIGQRDAGVGTIQILLLSFDSFDADVYYQYVASLARKQVDTEQLHVFKTLTGNKEVYSVFFGEYDTRRAAFLAIEKLPKALRDTAPIPRSVGGILQEIRRLDAKN